MVETIIKNNAIKSEYLAMASAPKLLMFQSKTVPNRNYVKVLRTIIEISAAGVKSNGGVDGQSCSCLARKTLSGNNTLADKKYGGRDPS
ncbi:hypothetical protein [Rhodoblastus sp.]|uniref:hypothetical protein n=2 Tax=Rhodoblastus sp. TaxID=1962975 RepID=UPI003F9C141C